MRHHRFYINPSDHQLNHEFWLRDERLIPQWLKVLRYREGDEVVLFDGIETERLYRIVKIDGDAVHLQSITDFERKLPPRHVYLCWSLLKKDKNDWVLQKCTELGVSNFVPLLAERSEKTGFNESRARKIVIEAAEQCGRGDIPDVREPITIEELINEFTGKITLLVCDEQAENTNQTQAADHAKSSYQNPSTTGADFSSQTIQIAGQGNNDSKQPIGVLIGPEGGWTPQEVELFKLHKLGSIQLGGLTLRAETAAVAAAAKLATYET